MLVCAGAQYFRSGDMDAALKSLSNINLAANVKTSKIRRNSITTQSELDYAIKLCKKIKKLSDYNVRVEVPLITVYVNTEKEAFALADIDTDRVKYVCSPPKDTVLEPGTIILPKCEYEYRITLGKTTCENSAFIHWAESNSTKVKLTRSCKRDMLKPHSFGGSHFYLTGDNVLLMAKMHLGSSISKIERVIRK